jgi:hypothetical protein
MLLHGKNFCAATCETTITTPVALVRRRQLIPDAM